MMCLQSVIKRHSCCSNDKLWLDMLTERRVDAVKPAHCEILHIGSMRRSSACGLHRRGHSFFSTNEELLDRYAECPGSAEIIAVQTSYLDALHAAPRAVPGVPQDAELSLRAFTKAGSCTLYD